MLFLYDEPAIEFSFICTVRHIDRNLEWVDTDSQINAWVSSTKTRNRSEGLCVCCQCEAQLQKHVKICHSPFLLKCTHLFLRHLAVQVFLAEPRITISWFQFNSGYFVACRGLHLDSWTSEWFQRLQAQTAWPDSNHHMFLSDNDQLTTVAAVVVWVFPQIPD